MRLKTALTTGLVLLAIAVLSGHTMFLKLPSHFLEPNSEATVSLINGTFEESQNVITRDRMRDVSIVNGSGAVRHPEDAQWHDEGTTSMLEFTTGAPGTYAVGVSTKERTFTLSAEEFDNYLEHDGVLDVLRARQNSGAHADSVRERYSKHVKALVQVGDEQSGTYDRALGYPIEIVPQQNPFALATGDELSVRVLFEGEPVADQIVYANYEGHHAHGEDGGHQEAVQTRTNSEGIASIPLSNDGRWYVRLIHMAEVPGSPVDYESNWATLTFEIE